MTAQHMLRREISTPKPGGKAWVSTPAFFESDQDDYLPEINVGGYFANPNFIWAANFNKPGLGPLFRDEGVASIQ